MNSVPILNKLILTAFKSGIFYVYEFIYTAMSITSVFTNDSNENVRIYLVTNNNLNYRILLPNPNELFIPFLEDLFKILDIDDYEISSRGISNQLLKNNLLSILANIFKTNDCYNFIMSPFLKTNDDFFQNLNQILINHLSNNSILKNFQLIQLPIREMTSKTTSIDKLLASETNEKQYQPSNRVDENFITNIGTKTQKSFDLREDVNIPTRLLIHDFKNKTTNNIEVLPYNDYENPIDNSEVSPFNDCYIKSMSASVYNINVTDDMEETAGTILKCSIIYCHSLNIGIVIQNDDVKHVSYLVKSFKDFEFIKHYEKLKQKELDDICSYFHKRDFETIELIKNKITSFETLFDIQKDDNSKDKTALEIEYYLKHNYLIDNEPKNIMKASVILDAIINDMRITCNDRLKLSKDISTILLKMGLKKKRLSDGIYYYGIVAKPSLLNSDENTEERFKKVLEEHKLKSVKENISILTGKDTSLENKLKSLNKERTVLITINN